MGRSPVNLRRIAIAQCYHFRMSNASEEPLSNQQPSSPRSFPPPQISDLLVLTLTTAYGMTWMGAFQSDPPAASTDWQSHLNQLAATLTPGLLFGVELFGFAVVVRELVRGRQLSSFAPGHWWFLITGPQYLLGGTHWLLSILGSVWFENQPGQYRMTEGLNAVFYGFFAALWLWATASVRSWQWRAVMGLKALEQLDWVVFRGHRALRGFAWMPRIDPMHFFGLMGTIHIGQILAVLTAIILDRRGNIRRDWLHHLAGVTIIAESLQSLFGPFGTYLLRWWSEIWFHLVG
jgi:hypothetical protein